MGGLSGGGLIVNWALLSEPLCCVSSTHVIGHFLLAVVGRPVVCVCVCVCVCERERERELAVQC